MTVDSAARSPLAQRGRDLDRAGDNTGGAVEIVEMAFLAKVNLRVDPAHRGLLYLALPLEPNTTTDSAGGVVLWLGPNEWLIVGPPSGAGAIAAALKSTLDGVHYSVVDVSANWVVVELRGSARHDLLSKGCSLDFHARAWSPGRCAQTLLARVQVILEERPGSTRVYVRPSFGDYLVDWILDATVEYTL
ncbi:MAG: sarcosine oxidase subunit gamma [Actinomycetota bacterium]|nr:sarcosine oxidase subunit gamma [Actinomycetota bacterium]